MRKPKDAARDLRGIAKEAHWMTYQDVLLLREAAVMLETLAQKVAEYEAERQQRIEE